MLLLRLLSRRRVDSSADIEVKNGQEIEITMACCFCFVFWFLYVWPHQQQQQNQKSTADHFQTLPCYIQLQMKTKSQWLLSANQRRTSFTAVLSENPTWKKHTRKTNKHRSHSRNNTDKVTSWVLHIPLPILRYLGKYTDLVMFLWKKNKVIKKDR